jgi:fermentation-respiration switch protein FrsA (DUF1100 family)
MGQSKTDYSAFDHPDILAFLFHPRPEDFSAPLPENAESVVIPVSGGEQIGACFHRAGQDAPTILFFHGNGEIVADYNDIAPLYNQIGLNFFPVDYRGYGRSTGRPSVSAMMNDCRDVFDFIGKWLETNGYPGPLIVMGRSLGSACALELAAACPDKIDALIIESGFAYALPLLRLLGIPVESLNLQEEDGFRNIDKIRPFTKPALIIHAQYDHIIPFSDGQALYDACQSEYKRMLEIKGADHNSIFFNGMEDYLQAVRKLAVSLSTG